MNLKNHRPVTALILAGERPGMEDPVAKAENVQHKALVKISGKPMISYVYSALRDSQNIGDIIISCRLPELFRDIVPKDTHFIKASSEGPSKSVYRALARFGTPLLVTTSDNVLLQTRWIDEFIEKTSQVDSDVAVAIATQSSIQEKLPHTQRTYIKLRDIKFSGCNLFMFERPVSARIVELWRVIEKLRKQPIRIALKLGLLTMLRALTGRLDQKELFKRLYQLTSAHVRLIPLEDGRAAVDVDKTKDLQQVRTLMNESQ